MNDNGASDITKLERRLTQLESTYRVGGPMIHAVTDRVVKLETEQATMSELLTELRKDVKELEKTIWKATGSAAVLVFLVTFALRHV